MVGRLDDWLKVLIEKENAAIESGVYGVGGRGGVQEDVQTFRERGYRIRLLAAAFRNHMHWSELIGGDIVISPPYAWQVRLNKSDIEVVPRIDRPVAPEIVEELGRKFVDFPTRTYGERDFDCGV